MDQETILKELKKTASMIDKYRAAMTIEPQLRETNLHKQIQSMGEFIMSSLGYTIVPPAGSPGASSQGVISSIVASCPGCGRPLTVDLR